MSQKKYYPGRRYGKVVLVKLEGSSYTLKCDCGYEFIAPVAKFACGERDSCKFCSASKNAEKTRQMLIERNKKHLLSKTPTYKLWKAMRWRCNPKNTYHKKYYYDKGIRVCDRWSNYELFLEDMGDVPQGMTLERIDNTKGYSKENCKWATVLEQARNKRNTVYVTYHGTTAPLTKLCEEKNVNKSKIRSRIFLYKWSVEEAFDTP